MPATLSRLDGRHRRIVDLAVLRTHLPLVTRNLEAERCEGHEEVVSARCLCHIGAAEAVDDHPVGGGAQAGGPGNQDDQVAFAGHPGSARTPQYMAMRRRVASCGVSPTIGTRGRKRET